MFGDYGICCDGRFVALVCDDQLFIKPTDAGLAVSGPLPEGAPYPGAKPHPLVEGDRLEDAEWLGELLRITAASLPEPKGKKPRSTGTRQAPRKG